MASISELRKKIKSIKSTKQITNAMKMVAGAKLGKAQRLMLQASVFPHHIDTVLNAFCTNPDVLLSTHYKALFKNSSVVKKNAICLICISADKGLCGDFNATIARETKRFITSHHKDIVHVFSIGTKITNQLKDTIFPHKSSYTGIFTHLSFNDAIAIEKEIYKSFIENNLTDIYIIYNNYVSAIRYSCETVHLLPLDNSQHQSPETHRGISEIEPFESDIVFDELFHLWFQSRLYRYLRSSYAAELSAAMRAMDNATRNASKLIDNLVLDMNKVRQASITRELTEIIGTSEVMKE